ncbi:acetyltransferase [Falsiroseomonas selenitidurans]|uniref:Acetyltransferase n=1 Tax=Falsiroseomonas selenitidurans TaxID=2716335 RepID=A0ABX1E857_9PROT|nr:acetyltransferase [Falsiroseomonas selenitidurans]NKC33369.1 acetyltransferase [Falsiroseomonas selenitidurans]
MKPVLVIGAGGHALVVIEALRAMGRPVAGLLDDRPDAGPLLGCPLLGRQDDLARLRGSGLAEAAIAIGDNATRLRLAEACRAAGYALPPVLHPAAFLSPSASLAEGVQVMARAVVGPLAVLGRLALVNTGAIVEHQCRLAEGAHLGPGAVLCGGVTLGARALVAAGAVVRPGLVVGADALVAPGAAVAAQVAEGARLGGVPARPLPGTA